MSCPSRNQGSPPAGFLYDSNMYSTPLSLLQLPSAALSEVTQKLSQTGNTCARITQDGKNLSDLKGRIPDPDFHQAVEVEVDIGFVCKKCQMVYPAEVLCLNHQRASCFPTKAIGDIKAMLKLVQIHVECRACRERFVTVLDFKFHCDMDRHIKRVQKLQREAAQKASVQMTQHHQQMQPPSSIAIATTAASTVLAGLSGTPAPAIPACTVVPSVQQASSAVQPASSAPPIPMSGPLDAGSDPTRNGLQDLLFNSGVQQDFRTDLDATLRLSMGPDNVIRGQGIDTSLDMFDPTSKSGMCYSGDSTLTTEATRL